MTNPDSHQFVEFPHHNQVKIKIYFADVVSKPFPGNRTHCIQSTQSFQRLSAFICTYQLYIHKIYFLLKTNPNEL